MREGTIWLARRDIEPSGELQSYIRTWARKGSAPNR